MDKTDVKQGTPGGNVSRSCHPTIALRWFWGAMAVSGAIVAFRGANLVPLDWYPFLMPTIAIWIDWLLIALGRPGFNTGLFWYASMGFNCFILTFVLWLRNGLIGPLDWPIIFVWAHLALAIIGSAVEMSRTLMLKSRNVA